MGADPLGLVGDALAAYIDARVSAAVASALAGHQCGQDGERLLSVTAACERASVGRTTLYRWIAEGLPTVAEVETEMAVPLRRVGAANTALRLRAGVFSPGSGLGKLEVSPSADGLS